MKLVIFGLTVSSSWGNGHATLWRGLIAALAKKGHDVVFFERDTPYYSQNRDLSSLPAGELYLYDNWSAAQRHARLHLRDADVAMVTSFCPDGVSASQFICDSSIPLRCFYDLDTPVTLAQISLGERPSYIGPSLLRDFDLVLSYTGGRALTELERQLGARLVVPIYGSVDPEVYRPASSVAPRASLSYLGTYARDRQAALQRLFLASAGRSPADKFIIGGAQYPLDFPWLPNIHFLRHVPPADHPAFYASARLTLNITRRAMADAGFCPSGRLFEAAACGVPIVTDAWPGLDRFFRPDHEILVVHSADDVLAAFDRSDAELATIGNAARERTLAENTADRRVDELETALEAAFSHRSEAGGREPVEAGAHC